MKSCLVQRGTTHRERENIVLVSNEPLFCLEKQEATRPRRAAHLSQMWRAFCGMAGNSPDPAVREAPGQREQQPGQEVGMGTRCDED